MTQITNYMDSGQVKSLLGHYIESSLISVQKRRGRITIKVKGNPGLYQAWMAQNKLRDLGLVVSFYAHEDDIAKGYAISVRISVPR